MRIKFAALLVLALVLIAGAFAAPTTQAVTGGCTVTPGTASTGSTLAATCFGLAPGALANVYFVEPDGRASTGCLGLSDTVWADPCTPRADVAGTVAFAIHTKFDNWLRGQLGQWTVAADNPGGGTSTGTFFLTGNGVSVAGALVAITGVSTTSKFGFDTLKVSFVGTGFAPGEIVNGWFDTPANCSGIGPITGDHTVIALSYPSGASGFMADSGGTVGGTATPDFELGACTGQWRLVLRALGSGIGGFVDFIFAGKSVTPTGAFITVTPLDGAFLPIVVINGSGFPPGVGVSCWSTRPDGRVLGVGNTTTTAGGTFGMTAFADLGIPTIWSAEPGEYSMTCATPDKSSLAVTTFTLSAFTTDP